MFSLKGEQGLIGAAQSQRYTKRLEIQHKVSILRDIPITKRTGTSCKIKSSIEWVSTLLFI